jgi:uncharacterized protein YcaQ
VLPPAVLAMPTPAETDAQRDLLRLAATALGVATAADLRDYFRLPAAGIAARLAELAEAGELLPVEVGGWRQQAYLSASARLPRRVDARALLSPFDPLVWERDRTERLFGFRYRLEIYTPAARRRHGYYVLPFLLGDRPVARVDLKALRSQGLLQVHSAHGEEGIDREAVAQALAGELVRLADWLGLSDVRADGRGDLLPALAARLPR